MILRSLVTRCKHIFSGSPTTERVLFKGKSSFRTLTVIENKIDHTRRLFAGNRLFVAGINTITGFPHNAPYFLADVFVPQPKRLLFLGGGAYAVPTYIWNHYHPHAVDVVEHDPLTTRLAKQFFYLPTHKNYHIFHEDAVAFLQQTKNAYDVIYSNIGLTRRRGLNTADLYGLCHAGGITRLKNLLTPRGVLVYIIIARLTGLDLLFIQSCLSLLRARFPVCYVFADAQNRPKSVQTVILVASKRRINLQHRYNQLLQSRSFKQDKRVYDDLLKKQIHGI